MHLSPDMGRCACMCSRFSSKSTEEALTVLSRIHMKSGASTFTVSQMRKTHALELACTDCLSAAPPPTKLVRGSHHHACQRKGNIRVHFKQNSAMRRNPSSNVPVKPFVHAVHPD